MIDLLFFYLNVSEDVLAMHLVMNLFYVSEVQVRVQVFDSGDLSPLANAAITVHGNQTLLAQSKASSDGVQVVSFLYRTGTWVIITASQRDYLTSSVPWHASRLPCE